MILRNSGTGGIYVTTLGQRAIVTGVVMFWSNTKKILKNDHYRVSDIRNKILNQIL
jgi:hypothetical protein